jgi:hypothetical protein
VGIDKSGLVRVGNQAKILIFVKKINWERLYNFTTPFL